MSDEGMIGGDEPQKLESQRSIPTPFLTKTYQIVDDPGLNDLISWNEDGTTFIVWRPAEFARDLLPKYFKHNNFSSFIRQLNTYGFRKVVSNRWEFANDSFRRGEKGMLRDIQRRKLSTGTTAAVVVSAANPESAMPVSAADPQSVTIPVGPVVALQISPANSGDEQALSSNSSLATATPSPALRACTSMPEILEENDSLRRENSQLRHELNHLRSLYSNIYSLMSSYATNSDKVVLSEGGSLELMPETQATAEDSSGEKVEEKEMCPRIFGVSIGVKRLRSEDVQDDDKMELLCGPEVKSEPLDHGSSSIHDIPKLN